MHTASCLATTRLIWPSASSGRATCGCAVRVTALNRRLTALLELARLDREGNSSRALVTAQHRQLVDQVYAQPSPSHRI
jgi:hypothetical protein